MAHFFSYFFSFRGIAQLVEQRSPKPRVVSSILTAPAIKKPATASVAGFYFSFDNLNMPFHSTKIVRVENFLTVFFRLSGKIVRV